MYSPNRKKVEFHDSSLKFFFGKACDGIKKICLQERKINIPMLFQTFRVHALRNTPPKAGHGNICKMSGAQKHRRRLEGFGRGNTLRRGLVAGGRTAAAPHEQPLFHHVPQIVHGRALGQVAV